MADSKLTSARVAPTMILAVLAFLWVPAAHAQATTGRMFDQAIVSAAGSGQQIIRIIFTCKIQYLSHFPADSGETLRIQLTSFPDCPDRDGGVHSDLIRPENGKNAALVDISYEGPRLGGPQVVLRFSREVSYSIEPGGDFRSLVVRVMSLPNSRFLSPSDTVARRAELYAINLESSRDPVTPEQITFVDAFSEHQVYVTEAELDGERWQRLRLGFYDSEDEARDALDSIIEFFPRAWVTRVDPGERAVAEQTEIRPTARLASGNGSEEAAEGSSRPKPGSAGTEFRPASEADLQQWMGEARAAFTAGDYRRAVQLYTKVLRYPDHPYRADAQEWLALTRERAGQTAHAKAEYQRYLETYPNGEGAERVRQRLNGLLTAARTPNATRGDDARTRRRTAQWDSFGSLNQYYYRTVNSIDDNEDTIVTQSSFASNMDLLVRRRGERFEFASRMNGGYMYDMLDDGPGNRSRVNTLYVEAMDQQLGFFGRLGRQTRNTGGVFGRFDGAHIAYDANDTVTLNLVAGYPVYSSEDTLDAEQRFVGTSVDLHSLADRWDLVGYAIQREIDGITDRQAVGMEVRYFDNHRSLLALVDHDISYSRFNNIQLLGNWRFEHLFTVNASYDYRRTPSLSTRNAMIGQQVSGLDELMEIYSEDELRDLAEDRTGTSEVYSLGLSRPLFQRFQASADISMMQLSGTPESGGVAAVPDSDNEFYYNFQLIGSGLLLEGDVNMLSLRYSDATSYNTASILFNTRLPVTRTFRINPRIRFDRRVGQNNDTTRWITAPALRIEYRLGMHRFEFEGGGQWSTMELTDETDDNYSYYFNLGYRADF